MELAGQKREIFGKKLKNVRQERLLPAVIFGKGLESLPIVVDYNDFVKVFEEMGETQVFDINLDDGEKHPVLVKEMQLDPISSKPIHIGFYEVNLKEKITANIPVEIENDEENELVKAGEAIVLTLMNEIVVEALPNDLPEKFVVDAIKLEDMDSTITIADMEYDREKVEIVGVEADEIVAKLDYAQMLEEEEEEEEIDEAEAIAGLEATGEKDADEDGEESSEEAPDGGDSE